MAASGSLAGGAAAGGLVGAAVTTNGTDIFVDQLPLGERITAVMYVVAAGAGGTVTGTVMFVMAGYCPGATPVHTSPPENDSAMSYPE